MGIPTGFRGARRASELDAIANHDEAVHAGADLERVGPVDEGGVDPVVDEGVGHGGVDVAPEVHHGVIAKVVGVVPDDHGPVVVVVRGLHETLVPIAFQVNLSNPWKKPWSLCWPLRSSKLHFGFIRRTWKPMKRHMSG